MSSKLNNLPRQNFKFKDVFLLLMKGINPHDEVKGSISNPKGKEHQEGKLELIYSSIWQEV
jgi:hypothetical protein